MDSIIAWFGNYWWAVLLANIVVMKVLNETTKHFAEHKGLVKWCLFIVDLLDILKSTPAPGGKP